MEKLTEQDLSDLQYFWQFKGDLDRLSTFEALKPLIENEYPEILTAWTAYKTSIKMLDLIMDDLK